MKRYLMIALIAVLIVASLAVLWRIDHEPVVNPRSHIVVGTADWHSANDLFTPRSEQRMNSAVDG